MNGFERRKEAKKEQILEAALTLFSKNGVQETNIQDIAKKANVSQVTIYNYFINKDKLIYEVANTFLEQQMQIFEQAILIEAPFTEKIKSLMEQKLTFSSTYSPDFIYLLVSDRKDIEELVTQYSNERSFPLLQQLIQEGRQSGFIDETLSDQSIFFYLNMFSNEIRKNPLLHTDPASLTKITEEMLHLFFYGLIGKK
ncbi:TetR/AcrR family transcriptional regulator [Bacillus solimangrovi]|uniref:HTH tetR-type domain-containing protein n=1 Tax=Bacillus solimangrovi TaxID=1305675 RepID=A0A1E5LJU3_9BACI|nr:TetR/AcrR family transcriptional regulator [Bacillus solimangrovi]OEH94345.1 hypothetical protein BFG57_08805 [Bacillus solimangrovi]